MIEAEFLERFDRHLEHSNAILESVDREVALTREEVRRSREAHEDLRVFTRDITTRNEKVWREVMVGLADFRKSVRRDMGKMGDRLDDMGDVIRAQTAAILTVLYRLEATP